MSESAADGTRCPPDGAGDVGEDRGQRDGAGVCQPVCRLGAGEKAFRGSALFPASEGEWWDLGANLEENSEVKEAHLCQIEG